MKRVQRINRVTRRRPPQRTRLLPIILIALAGGLVLQLALIGVVATVTGAGAVTYYDKVSTAGLAKLKQAKGLETIKSTVILDRKGRVLWKISDPDKGLQIYEPLNKIPRSMREAIIASEDKTFYKNAGIDPVAMASAALRDLRHQGYYGASTITQQTVKLVVFGPYQRSYQRKIQEALIAYAVSQPNSGFTKDQILQLYLNIAYFGHQAYGVEAAAKVYFGKDVWQLDLAQSAFLAGLVQDPVDYDPLLYGPKLGLQRMYLHVLADMVKNGYITEAQRQAAYQEARHFRFTEPHLRPQTSASQAPYWTDWIQGLFGYPYDTYYTDPQLKAIAEQAGGFTNGLTITTTLDLDMYTQAQNIMNEKVQQIAFNNVHDAAVVEIDPHSSECLAMVGGLDYYSSESGSRYNMAAQPREPGSSFKPFTYVTAFEKLGWSPAHMLLDEQHSWSDPQPGDPYHRYEPQNYDKSYHGAVTVRMALANSYNIPAVETIDAVGKMAAYETAIRMGVPYLKHYKPGDFGLSLTLGAKEVPLWQMTQAYNTFANGGVFRPMASVLAIDDTQGHRIYTYHRPRGVQVIAPQYAYLITSILSDNYARVPAFGPNSPLQLDRPAAVKTGTSQSFRDNLTIGYTPNLLVATWVGNPNGSVMNNVEGVDGAGPIWHDLMEWSFTHLNLPVEDFVRPSGVVLARVSSSGYLASQYTVWPITDYFAAGTVPHQYDNGSGNNWTAYRVLGYDFSADGGAAGNLYSGTTNLTPVAGATPGAGGTNQGTTSGSGGTLTYNPGAHANICNGGYYTYYRTYENGQLVYKYTCH